MIEDVKECFQKSLAVQLGLKAVYGIVVQPPLPMQGTPGFLDNWLIWARAAIRRLEIDQQDDVEFEQIIPLRSPFADGTTTMKTDYEGPMLYPSGNGVLSVDLTEYFDDLLGKLWVRGVGLTTTLADSSGPTRDYRVSAQVFPPAPPDLFSVNQKLAPRAPAIIFNVFANASEDAGRIYRGANVNNMDPRGTWTIVVNKSFFQCWETDKHPIVSHPMNPNYIRDIQLHLALTGRPNKSATAWHALKG
jgi:hypothetical protein